jgi:hypothetical protein
VQPEPATGEVPVAVGDPEVETEAEAEVETEAEAEAEIDAVADAEVDGGVLALVVVPPSQDTPLSAKFVGVASVPDQVPWKPKSRVPPLATEPL